MIGGVPVPFLFFLVCAIVGWLILQRTSFGQYVFTIGSNSRAAHIAGVPVTLTTTLVFVVVGIFTGLGSALLGACLYSAGPGLEPGFELNVIATVVLGGRLVWQVDVEACLVRSQQRFSSRRYQMFSI